MSDLFNEMLKAYEATHEEKRDNGSQKTYDLKNYFTTFLPKGVDEQTKRVRILPPKEGESLFWETMHGHKKKVDGKWKTLPCLEKELNEPCPFCEAREALYASGDDGDKELAKEYYTREYYILRVIDRDNESDGVKFWRIPKDFRKQGAFDKIMKAIRNVGHNITDIENGRDLLIDIARDKTKGGSEGIPMIQSINYPLEQTPLSNDKSLSEKWLSDERTWKDVYSIRGYEYLKIIVKGDVPVWDNNSKKYVGKTELENMKGSDDTNNDAEVLEAQLEMGLKTSEVKNQELIVEPTNDVSSDYEDDDLPF